MKKFRLIVAALSILATVSVSGQITVTGTAVTEIVKLATVKEEFQMNLGRFSTTDEGGSVTMLPEGTRLSAGSVVLQEGFASQGIFVVSGSDATSLNVLLPMTPVPLYHFHSASSIYLENWTKEVSRTESGSRKINIGATLRLKSVEANPAGIYTGKYQINILFD